jgi:hypothetical protein
VLDLATGAQHPLGLTQALAVAGRYVARTTPQGSGPQPAIVVSDAATGAELYRPGVPAAPAFPGLSAVQLALMDDGSVAYVTPVQNRLSLVVASPAAPGGRILAPVPNATSLIGIGPAGALLATGARLQFVPLDGVTPPRTLDLPDLVGEPAFDGHTITWAQRACVTTVVTSWRLGDPLPRAPDLRCPTARPATTTVTLPRTRRVSVGLACPGSARGGCLARVKLTAVSRARRARGANGTSRLYRLGSMHVALDPGEQAKAALLVPAGAARWVRTHARLRLRVEATNESTPAVRRPAGDDGAVVRTVGLRAAR